MEKKALFVALLLVGHIFCYAQPKSEQKDKQLSQQMAHQILLHGLNPFCQTAFTPSQTS